MGRWERARARFRHPSGLCMLALFVILLYLEFTQESGVSSSFMLYFALANLALTIWAGAAEKQREQLREQRRPQGWGEAS